MARRPQFTVTRSVRIDDFTDKRIVRIAVKKELPVGVVMRKLVEVGLKRGI
jgi:hypothetical protein